VADICKTSARASFITTSYSTRYGKLLCTINDAGTDGVSRFNEDLRLRQRHLTFDGYELAKTISAVAHRTITELVSVNRFAEGGFNRILQATFQDGQEVLARLAFKMETPIYHSLASEVATLHFLRLHGIAVPKVLDYSPVGTNPVGTEYMILEKVRGQPIGEQWFALEPNAIAKVLEQVVDIEQRVMQLRLPVSGSLYFRNDLHETNRFVHHHEE